MATLTPRVDWIDLRWPIAIYFFAIPTTIILWLIVTGVQVVAPALPRSRFALIGVALATFVMTRRVVTPRVSGHLPAGTYEITQDFVPAFLPPSLLYATSEPAASDHCFRWPPNVSRQEILGQSAGPLTVAVYLAHSPIARSTRHPYRLADFYATAALEGAVDCVR